MRTQVIRSLDGFLGLEHAWKDLIGRTDSPDIYESWDWVSLSVRHTISNAEELFFVVVYDQETCAAIFPLYIKRERAAWMNVKALMPINYTLAPFCGFCMDASYNERTILKVLMECLDEHRSEWDLLRLKGLNSKRNFTYLIKRLFGEKYKSFEHEIDVSPYLLFDAQDCKVNKRELKEIERRERKLRKEQQIQIQLDQPYRADIWERAMELNRGKWADTRFNEPKYAAYFERLVQCLCREGQAGFCYIEIAGKIEAVALNFIYGTKVYGDFTNYSREFAGYGLGLILLKHGLEHYRALGMTEFDFGGGTQPYKFYWTDTVHRCVDYDFCNNNRKKWLLSLKISFGQFGKSSGLSRTGHHLSRFGKRVMERVIEQATRRRKEGRTYGKNRDSANQPGMETVGS